VESADLCMTLINIHKHFSACSPSKEYKCPNVIYTLAGKKQSTNDASNNAKAGSYLRCNSERNTGLSTVPNPRILAVVWRFKLTL